MGLVYMLITKTETNAELDTPCKTNVPVYLKYMQGNSDGKLLFEVLLTIQYILAGLVGAPDISKVSIFK
jgi:hypothetical protein